jgi:hypothetical protein
MTATYYTRKKQILESKNIPEAKKQRNSTILFNLWIEAIYSEVQAKKLKP